MRILIQIQAARKIFFFFSMLILMIQVAGCGFHLRGLLNIPEQFRCLCISPDQPFDTFHQILKKTLRANEVQVVNGCRGDNCNNANILCIVKQNVFERNIAFGSDVQVNRVYIQFKIDYQITDPKGNVILDCNTLQVERELTVNPSAVLGTDHDRQRVYKELYTDAAIQLIRQLSYSGCSVK